MVGHVEGQGQFHVNSKSQETVPVFSVANSNRPLLQFQCHYKNLYYIYVMGLISVCFRHDPTHISSSIPSCNDNEITQYANLCKINSNVTSSLPNTESVLYQRG